MLEVRRRFWVGSGRPSMLMLVRSAAALATMRPSLGSEKGNETQIFAGIGLGRKGDGGEGEAGVSAQHGHCTSCLLVERIGLPFVAHGAAVVGRGERQSFSATCCGPCTTHVCVRLCGEGVGRECVWTARLSVCMRPLCTLVLPVAADADETPVLDNRTLRARGRARQQRTAKCISATPRSTRQCRL